ncbi:hypothetical protein COCC4DRAFT_136079 [Bipolaris maydis ATCC 48331]|uniref:Uncharacterized protein n=2 Tax=Cochliobolus heterostrophus TaxID=5016 RepID=M2UB50_COCH5|nr:uncharacterized protein COCC4DRAFT_136079 [Bipolaris maydis ATCC 48331]EMD90916.1 hypothetical protein COCHEDRAFT_1137094 [Bipolaris maydis C5]KAJ5022658.1 hypothetical protein J3E73DRAFT_341200 [Bipolaris maydis]ENI06000.1 hypothetical protein COCC4DRAFT_136079 [Bipolaris maydis ATCC 48331]KAJ5064671.1 hypothetical protein J3E74DRAFT_415667 [Bipolaris maydis]KAJ6193317.1 hypothetical protein J3E72DRAFT_355732 [Bipolaris maydis]
MRSYNYMTLFAGAVLAQESATVINFFQFDSTLTVLGSDAKATTFQNSCPSDAAGISAVPSDLLPTPDDASATPAPTPAPRMRRQASASDDDYIFCEPYTIVQGPETYEFHLTDPVPGAWTVDMKCSWKGEMTKADLTCDVTQSGRIPDQSVQLATTSVLPQSEIQDMQAYQVVSLVSASGAASPASASASVTPTPTATRAPSASGSKAPASSGSNAASTPSQGFAPAGPLPTGAMKVVGGAVGVFAVAMAL